MSDSKKIFIEMIDGTSAFLRVNAKKVGENEYKIESNKEFEQLESDCLFEFFPDDIIKVKEHIFSDGTTGKVANELLKSGEWTNRKLNEFMFKATSGKLELNKLTLKKYSDEIEKVWNEKDNRFFYPKLIETIKTLKGIG